jgi:hypothetical protein
MQDTVTGGPGVSDDNPLLRIKRIGTASFRYESHAPLRFSRDWMINERPKLTNIAVEAGMLKRGGYCGEPPFNS